ncbi:MAG: hypothetical protein GY894_11390 [Planctomycetes bacterium]|nr:hypothetical protein [Planctomycetota bacterium]MCP4839940.1 hypothetical protein [Planctomycetota bacterium]
MHAIESQIDQEPPSRPAVLFPSLYLWLVFFGSLDIMLTRLILFFSGVELNPIAQMILESWGVPGISVFKFSVIAFVIIVCEIVGRAQIKTAKGLALFAVIVTAFPVIWSSVLLISVMLSGELPPTENEPPDIRRAVGYAAPRLVASALVVDGFGTAQEGGPCNLEPAGRESSFSAGALAVPISPEN